MTLYLTVNKVKLLSLPLLKKYKKVAQDIKGKTENVTFIKHVSLHPRERMKRNRKVKTEELPLKISFSLSECLFTLEID